ncbi:aluminum-activated malate transporter 9 [Cucumis melo var. makuwa]|uniref:Aluminum-activated malate transporter 9 n=1 Tax=Cucumis melo var. makuwa TaxID=1194695 RepID=A0A5D3BG53_CUCMM|nr:aluminum-activated malate transporter 9 [Cucumis melo var. makuwa]TYJ98742.1 aluminum-activated malate transporter 9 [Cucumis melo var. makuwa]
MIRVIRRDCLQPDCLSVSSGYTTNQFVLGVPLGSPKTSYVPPGSHVARFGNVPVLGYHFCMILMGSKGKGRGKLASDREGSVTCHIGTQFCFRVYVSLFQHSLSIKSCVVTGATIRKEWNRGISTLLVGGLALRMAELSVLAEEWEEVMVVTSIFII